MDQKIEVERYVICGLKEIKEFLYYIKIGGVSETRNLGLENAKGRWIAFVDADDFINTTMYETMINLGAKEDADLICCCACNINKDSIAEAYHVFGEEELIVNDEIYSRVIVPLLTPKDKKSNLLQPVWNKLYRTEVLSRYNIIFDINLNYAEDWLFNIHFLTVAKRIVFCRHIFYNYDCTTLGTLSKCWRPDQLDKEIYMSDVLRKYVPQFYKDKNINVDILWGMYASLKQYVYYNGKKGFNEYVEKILNNPRIIEAYNTVDEVPRIFAKAKRAIDEHNKKKFVSWANYHVFDIELRYLCKRMLKTILGE